MVTGDMIADNPGEWMFHCHVGDHMMGNQYILRTKPYLIKFQKKKKKAGMFTTFNVVPLPTSFPKNKKHK